MASGDTKTERYLDVAANGSRADLPTDSCCETRSQTLIRGVAERIMNLEDEVHEWKDNPDIVDIVATYADLQNYDTSTLTDKDIIRVLQDEQHDGESTYYRWDETNNEFNFIGTAGSYYTEAEVDQLLSGKQNTLTAGSNIDITNDVISATDTTYSAFTGTDGQTAGVAGLVPAPATTDAGKFLKADGTWDTAGGGSGPTVVQTAGNSQTDVMSQNAVTKFLASSSSFGSIGVVHDTGVPKPIEASGTYNSSTGGSVILSPSWTYGCGNDNIIIGNSQAGPTSYRSNLSDTVSIGNKAHADYRGSIALGSNSKTSAVGEMNIGSTSTTNGYNSSNYRLLTGLYDGQSAHDAATVGQINATIDAINTALNVSIPHIGASS